MDDLIAALSHVRTRDASAPPCTLEEVLQEVMREQEHPNAVHSGRGVLECVGGASASSSCRFPISYHDRTGQVTVEQLHMKQLDECLGSGQGILTISVVYDANDGGDPFQRVYSFVGNPDLDYGGLKRLTAQENRQISLFCAESGRILGTPERCEYE